MSDSVGRAAELFLHSHSPVALTGAGISTASGIPDFRSASGLWAEVDPFEVASQDAFRHHPERFFAWVRPLAAAVLQANPNPAHRSLARLERDDRLSGIVTQNIDGLHRRAGSRVVSEVHGHLRSATCVRCFQACPMQGIFEEFVSSGKVPRCPACHALLKPDVVLFGEALPRSALELAQSLLAAADLILIVGSSLEVQPVASLPLPALDAGAHMIILNDQPTYLDDRADVLLSGDAGELLPSLVSEVLGDR